MITGLRLAFAFLTVIPVPPTAQIGRLEARWAMLLAPLAVAPIALLGAGLGWFGSWLGLPATLAGLVVVAVVAWGTRAMHLDGLADTVDGLGSGPDREKALRILRSGDVGPMGALSLILVVIAQVLGFGALLEREWGWLLVALTLVASRAALAVGCARGVPAARPDGLGALFAGAVPRTAAAALVVVATLALIGAGLLAGLPWWQPVLGVAVAAGVVSWLLTRSVSRFGGTTGDILGALVELTATALVLVLAAG